MGVEGMVMGGMGLEQRRMDEVGDGDV